MDDQPAHRRSDADELILTPVRGPSINASRLGRGESLIIGRSAVCGLKLDDPAVSRRHARIDWRDASPSVVDLGSRHGVVLNGMKLTPDEPARLRVGDRLSINPWTFRVSKTGAEGEASTFSQTRSEERPGSVAERAPAADSPDAQRLHLLMETAEKIHSADDEAAVFALACRALLGSGSFQRARIVRPVDLFERVELLASRSADGAREAPVSRTLLKAAEAGEPVQLRDRADFAGAVSLAESSVVSALCVPIVVGGVPDAYAYLDSSVGGSDEGSAAVAYCDSVAKLTALALANLRRQELEVERARTQRDIEAATLALRRLSPPEKGEVAGLAYRAVLRPGRGVGGDLFGVADLEGGKALVLLGDVSGKGIGAAITMAGVLSHILAVASTTDNPARIMQAANRFACSHTLDAAFVTLFLAVIDPGAGEARCCDAGHGLAVIAGDGPPRSLPKTGGGLPLGIDPDAAYTDSTIDLPDGAYNRARLVLFSDGVVEQPDAEGEQFGVERALQAFANATDAEGDVRAILEALTSFAGGGAFADDVAVFSVELGSGR
ncbi:MAG: SpoIIE family protein phosphatase [Phycisphaerales bacterium]|nr:SpoIIE family protein phosphatase [Phycisphaerales bacterium]